MTNQSPQMKDLSKTPRERTIIIKPRLDRLLLVILVTIMMFVMWKWVGKRSVEVRTDCESVCQASVDNNFIDYCKNKGGFIIKHEYNGNGCYDKIENIKDYELPTYGREQDFTL